jgi:hypothetical protein
MARSRVAPRSPTRGATRDANRFPPLSLTEDAQYHICLFQIIRRLGRLKSYSLEWR